MNNFEKKVLITRMKKEGVLYIKENIYHKLDVLNVLENSESTYYIFKNNNTTYISTILQNRSTNYIKSFLKDIEEMRANISIIEDLKQKNCTTQNITEEVIKILISQLKYRSQILQRGFYEEMIELRKVGHINNMVENDLSLEQIIEQITKEYGIHDKVFYRDANLEQL